MACFDDEKFDTTFIGGFLFANYSFCGSRKDRCANSEFRWRCAGQEPWVTHFPLCPGDVTASLWNPSGLAEMPESKLRSGKQGVQASMFYTDYSAPFGEAGEGLYYTFISGAMPLGDAGTVGATLQLQGQGTIQVTSDSPDVLREENLGTNMALTFTYADRITDSLAAGINGKMIRMVLG